MSGNMYCDEFAGVSRDYARGEWMSAAARKEAQAHLAECESCRQLLEAQQLLSASLQSLRREQAPVGNAPHVESALLASFRAQRHKPVLSWKHVAWAVPVAAALLLVAILPTRERKSNPPPVAALPQVAASAPLETAVEVPAPAEPASKPVRLARRPRATLAVAREQVTDFVPLRYGKAVDPGEPLQVVRIQLPRAELARLGLPVAPEGTRSMVKADVALGDDGLVKAIRFVY